MDTISIRRKPFIIGVMGSHRNDTSAIQDAHELGEAIARRGYVLLTGGGGGVMKAASKGAHDAGGLVLAILPNEKKRPLRGYPNEFVDIPIYTGMYDARNIINAKTPDVIVALDGGPGTLSEIAIALRSGTPVVGFNCPRFELREVNEFLPVGTVDEAMRTIDNILEKLREKE